MEYQGKTFADYLAVLKRRLPVVLVSAVVVLVIGVYVAYSLPPTYRSIATILIEQQNISSDFVETTVTGYADEQIQLVRQRVMTTPNLTAIIEKHGLYPDITATDSIEAAADELSANILLETVSAEVFNPRSGREAVATIAFTLSVDYSDPMLTQQIAVEFADLYLQENVKSRTDQVQDTIDFIQIDIDRAAEEVKRTSEALADFKQRHAGNLPELLNFNLQTVERTEQQLDNLDREIRDARTREFTLQTELATTPGGAAVDANGEPIVGAAGRLAQLQTERLRLLSIYTPIHPNVLQVEKEIEMLTGGAPNQTANVADLQTQLAAAREELSTARQRYSEEHPNVTRLTRTVSTLEDQLGQALAAPRSQQQNLSTLMAQDPVVQQLTRQIQSERSYLQTLVARRAELERKLSELQTNLSRMPQVEREYETLNRENELAVQRHNDAVGKLDNAQRAQVLEAGGSGERFTLIEPPRLPREPYKPNRTALTLLALVLAIGAGVVIATVLDSLDDSVKTASELAELTGIPALAMIPYVETATDQRKRLGMAIGMSTIVVGGVVAAVVIAWVMG